MKSRGVLVGGLAMGFVVVFWYMMVYSAAKDDVASTKSKVSEQQQENDELAAEKRHLESLEDQGPEIQAKLDALHAAVPEQADLAQFIEDANALGTEAGVAWVSISPSEPVLLNGVGTIQMTIQVAGGYRPVTDYVEKFEKMSRLVVVDTINLTQAESSDDGSSTNGRSFVPDDGPPLTVTLTARMFTQAVPGAPAVATTPTSAPADGSTPTTAAAGSNLAEG